MNVSRDVYFSFIVNSHITQTSHDWKCVSGLIEPLTLIHIIKAMPFNAIDANMRKPIYNDVVKSIVETLNTEPQNYSVKTKGITFVASSIEIADNIVSVDFTDCDVDTKSGVIDGGHNVFAILSTIYYKALNSKSISSIKNWDDLCSKVNSNMNKIESYIAQSKDLDFKIPVKIFVPLDSQGSSWGDFYRSIKDSHNLSTEVSKSTRYNDRDFFAEIQRAIQPSLNSRVVWKENDKKDFGISSFDVISLLSIPLCKYPKYSGSTSAEEILKNLASYKEKLVSRYVSYLEDPSNNAGYWQGGGFVVTDPCILSAIKTLPIFIELYDLIECEFIDLYNSNNSSNFRMLSCQVATNKKIAKLKNKSTLSYFLRNNMVTTHTDEIKQGFILPILAGFYGLLEFENTLGTIAWTTDAISFWHRHKASIVSHFKDTVMKNKTPKPQDIGKNTVSYSMCIKHIENLFLNEKLHALETLRPTTSKLP